MTHKGPDTAALVDAIVDPLLAQSLESSLLEAHGEGEHGSFCYLPPGKIALIVADSSGTVFDQELIDRLVDENLGCLPGLLVRLWGSCLAADPSMIDLFELRLRDA